MMVYPTIVLHFEYCLLRWYNIENRDEYLLEIFLCDSLRCLKKTTFSTVVSSFLFHYSGNMGLLEYFDATLTLS